jgi:hypothetical protein
MSDEPNNRAEKISFSASDDWDLIQIIAHQLSSRDPRVQIKELVDNALDAFSRVKFSSPDGKLVKVIIRKKDKRDPHIKIIDNGPGWEPHQSADDRLQDFPDFEYTVKHIGDSIKKKYAEFKKASDEGRSIGQFAIGLFSFWALGERLTIFSRSILKNGRIGPCSKMVWLKEVRDATIEHNVDPPSELLQKAGSVVIIDQLQKAQMNSITGNILSTYISRSCRTVLMKNPDIELSIDDHGNRFLVKPKKYEGSKFRTTKVETEGGFGYVTMEIFADPPVESPEEFQVPIFQKGAKVYNDVTEIPELNIFPWNAKKVYGEINYPFGNLSPSRTAFVNDEWLGAFIDAMLKVTKELRELVNRIDSWKRERQRSKFNEIFRETWKEIFKNLPEDWRRKGLGVGPPPPPPPPVEVGPMFKVDISPESTKVAFRTAEAFTARPYDINGNIIRDPSLIYYWKLSGKHLGRLTDDMKRTAHFQAADQEGIATLTVTVLQFVGDGDEEKTIKKSAATNLWVVTELPPPPPLPPKSGDQPPIHDEDNLGEDGDRSKYNKDLNIVYINDHHKDFLKAQEFGGETIGRYINFCYSKEIAVDRWKNLDSHELSERILELIALSERMFNWKEVAKKPKGRRSKKDANMILSNY